MHRPTATDPSFAPPGCDSWYVLAPVPNLQAGTDWNERSWRRVFHRALSAPGGMVPLSQSCRGIENLYLVGAGTHPRAGLPGVLCSAKVIDRLIPSPRAQQSHLDEAEDHAPLERPAFAEVER